MPGGELPLKNDEFMNNYQDNTPTDEPIDVSVKQEAADTDESNHDATKIVPSDMFGTPDLADEIADDALPNEENLQNEDASAIDAVGDDACTEENGTSDENSASSNAGNVHSAAKKEEKPKRVDSIFDFIELFVFTLAAVFIITSFFFRYSIVEGDSMQNTLQNEQKLILSDFFYTPKPGDIIVIDDNSLKDPIVKRVIAVEGQTITFKVNGVFVDGELLDEDYVFIDELHYEYSVEPCSAFKDNAEKFNLEVGSGYYTITVPENEIFVMGDHRNNSKDSRMTGTYHEDSVLGKVVIRF